MQKQKVIFSAAFMLFSWLNVFSQTNFKEQKVGHVFYVDIPDYMSRTVGLNSAAAIQFKNSVKDIAGFIIEDNKEELAVAEMNFTSVREFYDSFISDFLAGEKKREVSEPLQRTIGEVDFIECDAQYYDKDAKMVIYYFVGIAETKDGFYKLLCFGSIDSKEKYKADFQKILYSIKD